MKIYFQKRIGVFFFCILCIAFVSCSSLGNAEAYAVPDPRQVPQDFTGMILHYGYPLIEKDFEMLDELGAIWLRRTAYWSSMEHEQWVWDFSGWDYWVKDAKEKNKKLLAILAYDNAWIHRHNKSRRRIEPDERIFFLRYVEEIVTRYKGRVDAYEIWNEPNWVFWKGKDKDLFDLARETAKKIKEVDPDAKIVAGSFWRTPKKFIRGYLRSGVLEYTDIVSFHPYAVNPYYTVKLYDRLAAILAQEDFTGQVWVTEVGYPTHGYYPTRVSEDGFPAYIIKTLSGLAIRNIENIFWYELFDSRNKHEQGSKFFSEPFFGLVYPDYSLKKGYAAFALCGKHVAGKEYLPMQRQGLPASVVSLYFRGKDGGNTLILWNENRKALPVRVSLPGTEQKSYDIITGQAMSIETETEILLGRQPAFITWNGGNPRISPF
jgi:hypothetical protein